MISSEEVVDIAGYCQMKVLKDSSWESRERCPFSRDCSLYWHRRNLVEKLAYLPVSTRRETASS